MARPQIPAARIEEFWGWLQKNSGGQAEHQRLLELWLYAADPGRLRSPMELNRSSDAVTFLRETPARCEDRLRTRLAPVVTRMLHRSSKGDARDEDETALTLTQRNELRAALDPIIDELFTAHVKDRPLSPAEQSARAMGEERKLQAVRVKIADQRRRQKGLFLTATAGTFWATTKAVDGKAIMLLSSSPTTSPSPNLISMCAGEDDNDDAGEARGTWQRHEGALFAKVTSGDPQALALASKELGFAQSDKPPPTVVIDPYIIDRVRLNRQSAQATTNTGEGYFWWVPRGLLPQEEPALLFSTQKNAEFDRLCLSHPHLRGKFSWDRVDRKVFFRLHHDPGGGAGLARDLILHLRGAALFNRAPVTLLAPKAPFPKKAADERAATELIRRVEADNRRIATRTEGAFWFTASGITRTPLVVLLQAPPTPPGVNRLLDEDPRARSLVGEGTFTRDAKTRTASFTFAGAQGKPGLRRPLVDLLTRLNLFPGHTITVVR